MSLINLWSAHDGRKTTNTGNILKISVMLDKICIICHDISQNDQIRGLNVLFLMQAKFSNSAMQSQKRLSAYFTVTRYRVLA